ncbi:MAG: outer membrane beta-barrel protein [Dysgonamonadaceae bacterium]|jgi:opacity protein-like surface antigen|nr:outer membrane beta-barrel protein [Dysgonamonadaceae bacterium]MDD3309278.1 outer membrane beta-barrel protein [Dysgonamonadaceae bacterium]MDD3901210.1 outer membrane beta-barrel protein [Dysgonamonadaceae bacterium]MDD4399316.1 outer membrane beta-barrel protein [Dysgonamonadaceae bacterium]MEA5080522.1 outer membrane beta-barrel protein [Dysgonamonadaceae bacterium]
MKKIVIVFLVTFFTLNIMAQGTKPVQLHTELGYGIEFQDNSYQSFQIYVTPQYHFNKNIWVGGGVGLMSLIRNLDLSPEESNKLTLIPVYAASGYNFDIVGNDIVPFVNLKAGYGFMSKKYQFTNEFVKDPEEPIKMVDFKHTGGLYFSPSIGADFRLNNKNAVTLSLSYILRQTKVSYDERELSNDYNSGMAIMIGYRF